MGKPLMPWQQGVLDVGLEIDVDGQFCYSLVLVTVPRQSGKTTAFGAVMDHRAIKIPHARVWFTMQTAKDAVDWLTNEHWPLLGAFGNLASIRRMAGANTSNGALRAASCARSRRTRPACTPKCLTSW